MMNVSEEKISLLKTIIIPAILKLFLLILFLELEAFGIIMAYKYYKIIPNIGDFDLNYGFYLSNLFVFLKKDDEQSIWFLIIKLTYVMKKQRYLRNLIMCNDLIKRRDKLI